MGSNILSSLAILRTNWDQRGRDYVDNFVPFAERCVRRLRNGGASVKDIRECISDTFGLEIPLGATNSILERACDNGRVTANDRGYVFELDEKEYTSIEKTRSDTERYVSSIIQRFSDFSDEKFDDEWSEEKIKKGIFEFLKESSIPIVDASISDGRSNIKEEYDDRLKYQISAFIDFIERVEPDKFDKVVDLAKGTMLAGSLYYGNPETYKDKFSNTEVYLDTPFILDALKVNGDDVARPKVELLKLLSDKGAKLRCFGFTLVELDNVLASIENRLAPSVGNSSSRPRRSNPYMSSSDIRSIRSNLKKALIDKLNVKQSDRPGYDKSYSINEDELESCLQQYVQYERQTTRRHDVNALVSIHRLRNGSAFTQIEDVPALFVTTNSALVRASAHFFSNVPGYDVDNAPPCILEHDLTTRVWLKSPLEAAGLPRHRLIADSHAVLQPPEDLWDEYISECERLKDSGDISEEEYVHMCFADEGRRALSDATYNDPDRYGPNKISEIIDRARDRIKQPIQDKLQQENNKREEVEKKVESEKKEKKKAKRKAENVKEELQKKSSQVDSLKKGFVKDLFDKKIIRVYLEALLILLLICGIVVLPKVFWSDYSVPIALSVVLGVGSILGTVFSNRVKSIIRKREIALVTRDIDSKSEIDVSKKEAIRMMEEISDSREWGLN